MKKFSLLRFEIASIFLILLFLFGIGMFAFSQKEKVLGKAPAYSPSPSFIASPLPAPNKEITLLFGGDIMLDRGVEHKLKQNGGDWRFPFLLIAEELRKADLVFANLESQISDKGYNVGSIYSFRADPASIEGLLFAGIDVLSVANNHSFDYTRAAFADCLQRLREAGIAYTGGGHTITEARDPLIKEVKGTRIAFVAYSAFGGASWEATETQAGILLTGPSRLAQLQEDVQHAKSKADIVVVSVHAGDEYQKQPNQFQKDFAYTAIDAGADLVIGHHPHVTQPLEQYKQGWIAYSLGNFIFDQAFSAETMRGAILQVTLREKEINEVKLRETKLNENYQVYFP